MPIQDVISRFRDWKLAPPGNDRTTFRHLVEAFIENREQIYKVFPPPKIKAAVTEASGDWMLGATAGLAWSIFETTNKSGQMGPADVHSAVVWFERLFPDVERRREVLITAFEILRADAVFLN